MPLHGIQFILATPTALRVAVAMTTPFLESVTIEYGAP
jgi:hypothetical protein